MATKAKEVNTKPAKERTWNEYIFGEKKKKGLGNTETVTNTIKDTAINLGAGIGGGILGSSLGGLKGFLAGLAGVVAGVMYDIDTLTTAGTGAMVGSFVTPPEKVGDTTKDFATTAKDNSNYFLDKLKSVTMLDQVGKKKEEAKIVVQTNANTATAQPALNPADTNVKTNAPNTADVPTNTPTTTGNLSVKRPLGNLSVKKSLGNLSVKRNLGNLSVKKSLAGI